MSRSLAVAAGCITIAGVFVVISAAANETALGSVRSTYVELCGGCHGIQGVSAAREVPTLRARASWFMCTQEGREYLIRLPSVANAPLGDAEVAALMNFVVFELGAKSALDYPAYTSAEVAALRARALVEDGLSSMRDRLVSQLIARCGAPSDMRDYAGPGVGSNGGYMRRPHAHQKADSSA